MQRFGHNLDGPTSTIGTENNNFPYLIRFALLSRGVRVKPMLPTVVVILFASSVFAQISKPICSTEKINPTCYLYVDRNVPISMPTYQMKPGSSIIVIVLKPFHFETLTLDPQTIQALPGTDQGSSLLTNALPDLKGLQAGSINPYSAFLSHPLAKPEADTTAGQAIGVVRDDLTAAQSNAKTNINPLLSNYSKHARITYGELNEIASPAPRPMASAIPPKGPKRGPDVNQNSPTPWEDYTSWRALLLCQLEGDDTSCKAVAPIVDFSDMMQDGRELISYLPSAPSAGHQAFTPATDTRYFDSAQIEDDIDTAQNAIDNIAPAERPKYAAALRELRGQYARLFNTLSSYSANLTKINADLETYRTNISVWSDYDEIKNDQLYLGAISDPKSTTRAAAPAKMLGRQITYSLNAVNQVTNLALAVPSSSQKVSIATVSAIYADPRFEISTGAIISFQHNRSFANKQAVQPLAGLGLVVGDMFISETRTRPEVIPIVVASYRLFPEWTWGSRGRRGAFYPSAWVGLNPYNALPEFGAGPSISFRSILFSGFYHRSHDVRLLEGEYPNMVWCNVNNTASSSGGAPLPGQPNPGASCSPGPPAPSTQTYWTNAFGIGITVRIPTSFTAGTGGVSR
jgi:hypothetical protein